MKKLLMIAPLYPFPTKCGLSVRIGDLCACLNEIFELHYFTCAPVEQFKSFFNPGIFKTVRFTSNGENTVNFQKRIGQRLLRHLIPPHFDSKFYVPDSILEEINALHQREKYDACMIFTPTLARCLDALPDSVFKIIDTIDIWHQRYEDFKKIGYGNLLYHFRDKNREVELLKSADLVIAISLWDYDYMIKCGINPVYTPVSFKEEALPLKNPSANDILYASGNGPTNIDAVQFFVNEILPILRRSISNVNLKILSAGNELKGIYSNREDVTLLPFLNDIREAYNLADIVVVPLRIGSGLKIKVLESLAFGKPTIVSPAAIQGMPMQNYVQEHISEIPEIFADEVLRALKDRDYRLKLIESGLNIIRNEYNPEKVYGDLKKRLMNSIIIT